MSISHSTSAGRNQATAALGAGLERKDARERLGRALESGDLNAARQAFTDLSRARSGDRFRQFKDEGGTATNLRNDFRAIGSALQAGDLETARAAFTKMGEDFQAARAALHPQEPGSTPVPADPAVPGDPNGVTITTTIAYVSISYSYTSMSSAATGSQLDVAG